MGRHHHMGCAHIHRAIPAEILSLVPPPQSSTTSTPLVPAFIDIVSRACQVTAHRRSISQRQTDLKTADIYCIIYVCCVSSTSSISDRLCRGFPERMLCKIDPYPGHSVNRATTQHVETGGGHNVQISQSSRRGKSQSPTPGSGRRNRSCYVGSHADFDTRHTTCAQTSRS